VAEADTIPIAKPIADIASSFFIDITIPFLLKMINHVLG